MSVSYKDFSLVARSLLISEPCTEINLRCSISRGYYALYHIALEYADSVSVPPVSSTVGAVHSKLGAYYQNDMSLDMTARLQMKRIGYSLKALHDLRCKADYRLEEALHQIDADAFSQRCMTQVELVEQLMASKAA